MLGLKPKGMDVEAGHWEVLPLWPSLLPYKTLGVSHTAHFQMLSVHPILLTQSPAKCATQKAKLKQQSHP